MATAPSLRAPGLFFIRKMRSDSESSEGRGPARGWILRSVLICGVFAATWYGLKVCGTIGDFQLYYRYEWNSKPLAPATRLVFDYRTIFLMAVLIAPGAALATFFIRDRLFAALALLGLIALAGTIGLLVSTALQLPVMLL